MTVLGNVLLRKDDGSQALVQVSFTIKRDRWGREITVFKIVNLSNQKKVGSLRVYASKDETEILKAANLTHKLGKDKIHMGGLFIMLSYVKYEKSSSKALTVHAISAHWFWMRYDFSPVNFSQYSMWRFEEAQELYDKLKKGAVLSSEESGIYKTERDKLAKALGVIPENLAVEKVCKIKDLSQEMRAVFNLAVASNAYAPKMSLPMMEMQMGIDGKNRARYLLLNSSLNFHFSSAQKNQMQADLLNDFHSYCVTNSYKSDPENIFSIVSKYFEPPEASGSLSL